MSETSTSISTKLNPIDYTIYSHVWGLPIEYKSALEYNTYYYCSVKTFLDHIDREKYPLTYNDHFVTAQTVRYVINYIYCSPEWLEALEEQNPDQLVIFQLRCIKNKKYYSCLVRPFEPNWTVEWFEKVYKMKEWKK